MPVEKIKTYRNYRKIKLKYVLQLKIFINYVHKMSLQRNNTFMFHISKEDT